MLQYLRCEDLYEIKDIVIDLFIKHVIIYDFMTVYKEDNYIYDFDGPVEKIFNDKKNLYTLTMRHFNEKFIPKQNLNIIHINIHLNFLPPYRLDCTHFKYIPKVTIFSADLMNFHELQNVVSLELYDCDIISMNPFQFKRIKSCIMQGVDGYKLDSSILKTLKTLQTSITKFNLFPIDKTVCGSTVIFDKAKSRLQYNGGHVNVFLKNPLNLDDYSDSYSMEIFTHNRIMTNFSNVINLHTLYIHDICNSIDATYFKNLHTLHLQYFHEIKNFDCLKNIYELHLIARYPADRYYGIDNYIEQNISCLTGVRVLHIEKIKLDKASHDLSQLKNLKILTMIHVINTPFKGMIHAEVVNVDICSFNNDLLEACCNTTRRLTILNGTIIKKNIYKDNLMPKNGPYDFIFKYKPEAKIDYIMYSDYGPSHLMPFSDYSFTRWSHRRIKNIT